MFAVFCQCVYLYRLSSVLSLSNIKYCFIVIRETRYIQSFYIIMCFLGTIITLRMYLVHETI